MSGYSGELALLVVHRREIYLSTYYVYMYASREHVSSLIVSVLIVHVYVSLRLLAEIEVFEQFIMKCSESTALLVYGTYVRVLMVRSSRVESLRGVPEPLPSHMQ